MLGIRSKVETRIQPTLPSLRSSSIKNHLDLKEQKNTKGNVLDCTTTEDVPKPLQEMKGQLTGRRPDGHFYCGGSNAKKSMFFLMKINAWYTKISKTTEG